MFTIICVEMTMEMGERKHAVVLFSLKVVENMNEIKSMVYVFLNSFCILIN